MLVNRGCFILSTSISKVNIGAISTRLAENCEGVKAVVVGVTLGSDVVTFSLWSLFSLIFCLFRLLV